MRYLQMMFALIGAVLFCTAGAGPVAAQGQITQPFTVAAGATVNVEFEAFCNDFGKAFPATGIKAPNDIAGGRVRAALAYIQQNNLTSSQESQNAAQYAIWRLRGAANAPQGNDQTLTIINSAVVAPADPAGVSVLDAARDGRVTVEIRNWRPKNDKIDTGNGTDYSVGQGTMVIRNTTAQPIDLYVPVGLSFGPIVEGEQTMIGYATSTNAPAARPSQQSAQLPESAAGLGDVSLLLMAAGIAVFGVWVRLVRREVAR